MSEFRIGVANIFIPQLEVEPEQTAEEKEKNRVELTDYNQKIKDMHDLRKRLLQKQIDATVPMKKGGHLPNTAGRM